MGRWYHWGMVAVLAVVLGMGKFLGVEATNSFSQTNWADNSFSSSSGVTTTTANQITLSNPSGWLNNAWKYRQSVGVTNATGLGLTDYQVPIFLDTAALISAAKMKNDCSDLRVADASGNSLSFWISTSPAADTCGQTKTKIWVKAASLPTTGTNLYVYYGNSSANSQSNGSDVFPVFADFTVGTSLPSNWFQANIGTSGTYSVGGSLAISNTNGEDVWNSVYGATHVYYGTKINGSFTAETLITSQANSNEWSKSGISIQNEMASGGGNGQAFIITTPSNGVPFQYQSLSGEQCNGGVCSNVIAPNVNLGSAAGGTNLPLFLKMKKSSDNRISGYRSADGSSWTQRGTSEIPWGAETNQYVSLFITPHNTSATGKATYTFFYTRKYSGTEPEVGGPNGEQKTYTSTGTLVSSIFDAGTPANFGTINLGVTTPTNTTVTVKVRTASNADMSGATDFASCEAVTAGADISTNSCVTDGQRYLQYQVILGSSDNLNSPTVNSLSVQYSPVTFVVSFLAGANGSISGTATQTVGYGSDATEVTAVASSGYHFTNWSDSNTQNPRRILMVTADKTVTANFAADDPNAPVISGEGVQPGSTSATISWTTDEVASSQVQYGLNQNYGFATTEADTSPRVTNHRVELSSLKSCARYYYRVISNDATANQSASAQKTLTTSGCAASNILSGTETVLPTSGGSVQLVNSYSVASLTVPNNFANKQATFQLNKLETNNVPTGPEGKTLAGSNFYDLVAVTESDEQLTTFSNPVTLTINYGGELESSYEESTLDVYKYDGSSWNKKNCTLNTAANTLTCSLSGFSVYGVLGQSKGGGGTATTTTTGVSNSSSGGECGDQKPVSAPDLFQINTTKNTAKLFFTPIANTNRFVVSFSTRPEAEDHGEEVTLLREGVQSQTVFWLKPNTTYYFKVRGQNGCATGDWGNILMAKTNGNVFYRYRAKR